MHSQTSKIIMLKSLSFPLYFSVLIFAPIIGGLLLLSILPILLSTIMAYCVTGYIRDELFASIVKKFIGPVCSFCVSMMDNDKHVLCDLCPIV